MNRTDIESLIAVTGLDPSVQSTLERFKGQQIAVIKLQTKPTPTGGVDTRNTGQYGLHLSWTSEMSLNEGVSTYTYPLGTGSAWSQPIEFTRVYVVAPPEINFQVQYPKLGDNYSGHVFSLYGLNGSMPRILSQNRLPAYAVDQATNTSYNVWRVIYEQSNSSEDIVITASRANSIGGWIQHGFPWRIPNFDTFLISIIAALGSWMVVWRFTIPRLVGTSNLESGESLWMQSLNYPGLNLGMLFIALFAVVVFAGIFLTLAGNQIFLYIATPIVIIGALGLLIGVPARHFVREYSRYPNQTRSKLLRHYLWMILLANAGYLVFVIAWSGLTGLF